MLKQNVNIWDIVKKTGKKVKQNFEQNRSILQGNPKIKQSKCHIFMFASAYFYIVVSARMLQLFVTKVYK